MDDLVELVEAAFREGKRRQSGPVERAVGPNDGGAEVFADAAEDFLARLHHLARDSVGLEDVDAMLAQDAGHGGFAAAETTREAYTQHASPIDTPWMMGPEISDVIVRRVGTANRRRERNVYRV